MGLGNKGIGVFLLLALLVVARIGFAVDESPEASVGGRYVGVLRHDRLGKEQLAKLDLILARTSKNELEFAAVLTLQMGDFRSGEYVTYHYDSVRFNMLAGTLIFSQTDQPLSIGTMRLAAGELKGKVRSNWVGPVGEMRLRKDGSIKPELPLIEPLWGEYAGRCGRADQALQLYTYRSTADLSRMGHPFAAFEIRGQVGERLPKGCLFSTGGDRPCIMSHIKSGDYNFFREKLILAGTRNDLSCDVRPDGLSCDGCFLRRVSSETAGVRALTPPTTAGVFTAPTTPEGGMLEDGEYEGYVHHDYLGVYQRARLEINTFQTGAAGEEGGLRVESTATVYFGDKDRGEAIHYRFEERAYPNPLVRQVILLRNPKQDTDAIVQITSIEKDVLRGFWHSVTFGRVGAFELRKRSLPTLPPGAEIMESVAGEYESTDWDMSLRRRHGTTPISTENPFFPNVFSGSIYLRQVEAPAKARITNGSYDFYTGRIGLERYSEQYFVGTRLSRRKLTLNAVPFNILVDLPKHEPMAFRLRPTEPVTP